MNHTHVIKIENVMHLMSSSTRLVALAINCASSAPPPSMPDSRPRAARSFTQATSCLEERPEVEGEGWVGTQKEHEVRRVSAEFVKMKRKMKRTEWM
jgi:hypothetical protein